MAAYCFHPKLYFTRKGWSLTVLVGSANLTGGLISNIEAAMVMTGNANDQPIADAWMLGDELWDLKGARTTISISPASWWFSGPWQIIDPWPSHSATSPSVGGSAWCAPHAEMSSTRTSN